VTGDPKTVRFDSDFARTLIGKRLLVGVTYVSQETGELLEQVQFHGPVEVADERGIAIRRGVDDLFWMPPDTPARVSHERRGAGTGERFTRSGRGRCKAAGRGVFADDRVFETRRGGEAPPRGRTLAPCA
jgi:hypothetical protein